MSDEKNKSRGRPREISNDDLKNMALSIKNKYRGQRVTYKFLERETGIGRQTWKRRIGDYIHEINKPITINSDEPLDDVYFPNIEEMLEKHKNDENSLINELYHFEEMFRQLYQEVTSLKKKVSSFESLQELVKQQEQELKQVEKKAKNYENLYKELVISSGFSHLRQQQNIKKNLIQFDSSKEMHTTLEPKQFSKMLSEKNDSNGREGKELACLYPELFKDD